MADNPTVTPPVPWSTSDTVTNNDGSSSTYTVPAPNRVDVPTIMQNAGLGLPQAKVDQLQLLSQISPSSSAIGSSFYGINHRQTPPAIPINRDYYGLAFFTRPYMNMSTANLQTHRLFTPLLSQDKTSYQRAFRCLLDLSMAQQGITSPIVDPLQAFISPLTNHLLSMAGWPDISVPMFTSHDGLYKEVYGFGDGNIPEHFQQFNLTASFRNLPGDPITSFFFYWCEYIAAVFEGSLVPYPGMIFNNEVDYNTRIYRVVLDSTKTKVQKIAACGAAMPQNSPVGAAFNFESQSGPLNSSNDQITINFQCYGATYLDDILIDEFNRTVALFNPAMSDSQRSSHYVQVPMAALPIFNNTGYARIDPTTYELQWWVDQDQYNYFLPSVQQIQQLNQVQQS
jgi:hypothetical protein